MKQPLKIVYVEDNQRDVSLVRFWLEAEQIDNELVDVETRDAFIAQLAERVPDVIFSDYTLPAYSGLEALMDAKQLAPHVPFIFLSGTIGEENAIESLRNGATDYVLKNNLSRLPPVLRRALAEKEEQQRRRQAEERIRQNEKRFNAFMNNIPGVAFMKDKDRRYVFINAQGKAYISREPIDCLGLRDEEILTPELAEEMRATDERVLKNGEIVQRVERIDLTGELRDWLITKFPIPDKFGTTTWLGGVGIDLTHMGQKT
jgi:CheY-like chemotaxis protein